MKQIALFIASICAAFSATAQSASVCDSMLREASDAEMTARSSYLARDTSHASQLMKAAATSFDKYAGSCGLGPMAYVGVLIHARLSLLYRGQGNPSGAESAAASAGKYAEILRKRRIEWPEIENIVRDADLKQRAAANK